MQAYAILSLFLKNPWQSLTFDYSCKITATNSCETSAPRQLYISVRALGFNGKWGKPAVYNFIVNTPFWQRAWFILLIVAVLGTLVYALYRYRVKQLIRLQKVRNRIATDLHDEIGSTPHQHQYSFKPW
jgi:hypothetical protein